MEEDRDQLTPDEAEDRAKLQRSRGKGSGGTGNDRLPGEEAPANLHDRVSPRSSRIDPGR